MIQAHITIPEQKAGGFVLCLIDSGADCTTIMPNDGRMMHVDYSKFVDEDHSVGSAGPSLDFLCNGTVAFERPDGHEYEYDIRLRFTKPDPSMPELLMLPSLLGRDILNRWKLLFDPSTLTIKADILSSDRGS